MRRRVVAASAGVALVVAVFGAVVADGSPAGATTVNDEASFRTAFANASETNITLTGNVTISTCGTPPTRNSSTALTIDGGGFTLTQTCANVKALEQGGSGALDLTGLTISGGNGVDAAGSVSLTNSTITGASSSSATAIAIDSGGDVTLNGSTISNTTQTNDDDAIAIDCSGNASLTNSTVTGTAATSPSTSAFAIDCGGNATLTGSSIASTTSPQESFGIDVGGAVTLTSSSISNTTGTNDSAFAIDNGDDTTLTDSQISGTTSNSEAFAIDTGGAVTLVRSTVTSTDASFAIVIDNDDAVSVTNSTITANGGAAIDTNGAISLVYADIVGNGGAVESGSTSAASSDPHVRGPFGPAAHDQAATQAQIERGEGALTTFASVIAKPQGVFVNCTPQGSVSEGYNFSDDTTCQLTGTGDQQSAGADPQLGALADNGGPTLTLLPATTSPLVDGVPTSACSSDGASGIVPLTDQRGLPRPQFAGCDIGAVELQPAPVPPAPPAPPTPAAGVVVQPRFTG